MAIVKTARNVQAAQRKCRMNDEQKALALYRQLGNARYKEFRLHITHFMAVDTKKMQGEFDAIKKILIEKGLVQKIESEKEAHTGDIIIRIWKKK